MANIVDVREASNEQLAEAIDRVVAMGAIGLYGSALREAAERLRHPDSARMDWLEKTAKKSRTGIAFDWVPRVEGERAGFRFMRRHFIGEAALTLRDAIDKASTSPVELQERKEKDCG